MTEQDVRELRNKVYEQEVSDKCWDECKENWMKEESINWLQAQLKKKENEIHC